MEVGVARDDGGLGSEVGVTKLDTLLQERKRWKRKRDGGNSIYLYKLTKNKLVKLYV